MIVMQMSLKGDLKDRMNKKENILEDRQAYYANQAHPDQQSFPISEASGHPDRV